MRWRVALLAVAIAAAALQSSSAPKRVEILKQPRFIFDDTPIGFYVRTEPHPSNRLLRVAVLDEVGTTVRSSDEDLDGEGARISRLIEWDSLDAGSYAILARIYDEAGARCARTAEYWGSCKALASATSNLDVRGFSERYSPFDDPQ